MVAAQMGGMAYLLAEQAQEAQWLQEVADASLLSTVVTKIRSCNDYPWPEP